MKEIAKTEGVHGWRHWLIASLTLLAMILVQPVLAQDDEDEDESLSSASGNKMQTDSLSTSTFDFSSLLPSEELIVGQVQLPSMGRAKVGENNSALPQDRFYFVYKHFHNSLSNTLGDGFGTTLADRDLSLDRYNIGIEKTFGDESWSVELRMPFIGNLDFFNSGFSEQVGGIGNLSVITKKLIHKSDTTAWAAGLGFSAPTGADAQIHVMEDLFTIKNEAVHYLTFAGFLAAPTEQTFYQGFIQLDVPLNGNSLVGRNTMSVSTFPISGNSLLARNTISGSPSIDYGTVRDQVLLYVDVSGGYRLYQDPSAGGITGLAAAMGLHYTTTLENANTLVGTTSSSDGFVTTDFDLGNAANRFDVLNLSVGLYATWLNRHTAYMGIVAPLDNGTNRFFDMEAQMSLNFSY